MPGDFPVLLQQFTDCVSLGFIQPLRNESFMYMFLGIRNVGRMLCPEHWNRVAVQSYRTPPPPKTKRSKTPMFNTQSQASQHVLDTDQLEYEMDAEEVSTSKPEAGKPEENDEDDDAVSWLQHEL